MQSLWKDGERLERLWMKPCLPWMLLRQVPPAKQQLSGSSRAAAESHKAYPMGEELDLSVSDCMSAAWDCSPETLC